MCQNDTQNKDLFFSQNLTVKKKWVFSAFPGLLCTVNFSITLINKIPGTKYQMSPLVRGGGGTPIMEANVTLQRPPIFSAASDPIFLLIVSAVTQRPPIFCIQLPQEATFCFNFIDKLIIFAILDIFFCKFLLFKRLLKDQK